MDNAFNVFELKNNNRRRVLEQLRFGALSRAELAKRIGLAKSSVTVITNEMIKEGLLFEAGITKMKSGAGRTSILLKINKNYGFAIGINLHRKYISVAAVDLLLSPIFSFNISTKEYTNDKEAIKDIKKNILHYLKIKELSLQDCVGIGVASPGPIDYQKGMILKPPKFSIFNNYPIVKELKKQFNLPVFLNNNSVSLALLDHNYSQRSGNSLFVIISEGIGSALLQNGMLFSGARGISGELGHISIDSKGEKCPCGNRGCLETIATLSAVSHRFKFDDFYKVVDKWEVGDKKALKVLDFLTQSLGTALVAATNLYDLDSIVLYGEYSYKGEILTAFIEDYIKEHSIIARAHEVKVVPSVCKIDDAPKAAALFAINHFFENNIEYKK